MKEYPIISLWKTTKNLSKISDAIWHSIVHTKEKGERKCLLFQILGRAFLSSPPRGTAWVPPPELSSATCASLSKVPSVVWPTIRAPSPESLYRALRLLSFCLRFCHTCSTWECVPGLYTYSFLIHLLRQLSSEFPPLVPTCYTVPTSYDFISLSLSLLVGVAVGQSFLFPSWGYAYFSSSLFYYP